MNLRKIIHKYQDIFFYRLLEKSLSRCKSVLDVGCGEDSPLGKIKKTFWSEGIDIFKPSLTQSKKEKIHDRYILGDIRRIDKFYKPKSFDAVIALDIVEHFSKKEAERILKKFEIIARKKIIVLTPNGFHHQDHYDNNPYQEHKSGWTKDDLTKLGFYVVGLRGLKYLRGYRASIKHKPWFFWGIVAFFSEPLLYFFPELSYQMLGVKKP